MNFTNFTNDPMHSPLLWPICLFIGYVGVAMLVCFRPRAFRYVLAASLLAFAIHAHGQAQVGPTQSASALGPNHASAKVIDTGKSLLENGGSTYAQGEQEKFRQPLVLNQDHSDLAALARSLRRERATQPKAKLIVDQDFAGKLHETVVSDMVITLCTCDDDGKERAAK